MADVDTKEARAKAEAATLPGPEMVAWGTDAKIALMGFARAFVPAACDEIDRLRAERDEARALLREARVSLPTRDNYSEGGRFIARPSPLVARIDAALAGKEGGG